MTCSPTFSARSASASPTRRFRSSDSTTQGPAMRKGEAPAPKCCAMSVAATGELRRPLRLSEGRRAPGPALLARRAHDPCELDDRRLQSQADPEEGELVLARPTDRLEHAFHAAHAEAPGHQQSVIRAEQLARGRLVDKPVGRDPIDLYAAFVRDAAVPQRFG